MISLSGFITILRFKGRIGRVEWIVNTFISLSLILSVGFLADLLGNVASSNELFKNIFGIIALITVPLSFYIYCAGTVKRLHDLGHSGWLLLSNLVLGPFFWFWMVLYPGQVGTNKYGDRLRIPFKISVK